MLYTKIIFFTLLICTTGIFYCLMNKKKYIPLEILFGNPQTTSPQISPLGTHLAYIKPNTNNILNVWIKTIDKNDDMVVTNDTNKGIHSYLWSQDNEHILYLQDRDGDENNHIYMTNITTKETIDLTPHTDVKASLMAHNKFHPDYLIFAMNKDDKSLFDVYKINLKTKETTLIQKNWGTVSSWVVTSNLNVKAAIENAPDGSFVLKIKQSDDTWKEEIIWTPEDTYTSGASHFSLHENDIYLTDSRDRNTSAFIKYNLTTKEQIIIAEHATAEVESILIDSDTLEPIAVEFYEARGRWKVLNSSIQEDFDNVAQLHHGDFHIESKNNDQDKWIVLFYQDAGPAIWYLYDRKTKIGKQLFYSRPELLKYTLQPMQSIKFIARDGLEIHGYVTYPENYTDKKSPLVLNVHGGPWARDHWGYNSEVQFFANRGYACLQINFRGSTGYGKQLLNAGNKEWSGKMHTDLIDGIEYIKKTGYINESKIAIYGGSYGGYAALVGATFTPDYFNCAIDIVGPSNIITLIQSIPPYWKPIINDWKKRVGDIETEEGLEFLKSISPLFKADQIKIPMLIAQGANDPRVKEAEADQIVAAMKKHNISHQYVLFKDEGHGFAKPHNKLKFYGILEKFLEKHLQN